MFSVCNFNHQELQIDTDGDIPRIANMSAAVAHSMLSDSLEEAPVDHEIICGITTPHLGSTLLVGDDDPDWFCMLVKEEYREANSTEWYVFTSTRVRNIQYFHRQEFPSIGGRQGVIVVHDYPLILPTAKHHEWLRSLKANNPELSTKTVPEGEHNYLVLWTLEDNYLMYVSEAPLEDNWVESMVVISKLSDSTELNLPIEAFISIDEDEVFDD